MGGLSYLSIEDIIAMCFWFCWTNTTWTIINHNDGYSIVVNDDYWVLTMVGQLLITTMLAGSGQHIDHN